MSKGEKVGVALLSGISTFYEPSTGSFKLNSIMTIKVSTSSALCYDGMPHAQHARRLSQHWQLFCCIAPCSAHMHPGS